MKLEDNLVIKGKARDKIVKLYTPVEAASIAYIYLSTIRFLCVSARVWLCGFTHSGRDK
ncbi:unnamed protein product [Rhodiola kirilowii]